MSSAPLDIKVVYSARTSGKPRRAGRRATPAASRPRTWSWAALGLMNLLVAAGFYYATWWEVDPFLYITATWKAPIPGVNVNAAAGLLGLGDAPVPKQQPSGTVVPAAPQSADGDPLARTPGVTAQRTPAFQRPTGITRNAALFGGAMYGWLTLSTVSYSLLAVAAGATLARAGAGAWRRKWVILLGGALLAVAYIVFDTSVRFGWKFPPDHLRWMMGTLVVVGALLGLSMARWPRGFTRIAAAGTILAAAGSVAGLIALKQCDALEKPEYGTIPALAMIFAIHSIYGWLLLPISSRIGRS